MWHFFGQQVKYLLPGGAIDCVQNQAEFRRKMMESEHRGIRVQGRDMPDSLRCD